jgi:hypothetical protein
MKPIDIVFVDELYVQLEACDVAGARKAMTPSAMAGTVNFAVMAEGCDLSGSLSRDGSRLHSSS